MLNILFCYENTDKIMKENMQIDKLIIGVK